MRYILLLISCVICAGCGCDGYNEPSCNGSSTKTSTTKTTDVGTLTFSDRQASAKFATTITTTNTFSTYTSLIVPVGTAVQMTTETDTTTNLVTSRTLHAGTKSTLVNSIVP